MMYTYGIVDVNFNWDCTWSAIWHGSIMARFFDWKDTYSVIIIKAYFFSRCTVKAAEFGLKFNQFYVNYISNKFQVHTCIHRMYGK